MPHDRYLASRGEVPEGTILKALAMITLARGSDASYWVAADENGAPEGTFMVVCVLGPKCITDLQAALKVCMEKWEAEDEAS